MTQTGSPCHEFRLVSYGSKPYVLITLLESEGLSIHAEASVELSVLTEVRRLGTMRRATNNEVVREIRLFSPSPPSAAFQPDDAHTVHNE